LKPSQVVQELEIILSAGLSAFIRGAPGIGKSTVVKDYALDRDLDFRDIRAAQLDPVDARGVPIADISKKLTSWLPPDFLPSAGKGILFLDELNRANRDTQSALYQLILDGRVGDYVLPPGWDIVAAGNREIDGAMVQPMARPLKNRFIHLEMTVDYEDWHKYAHKTGFDERVIAFMHYKPSSLDELELATKDDKGDKLDIIRNAHAFATPRSWEFVSRLIQVAMRKGRSLKDCYNLIEGTIGEGMAGEFVSYCDIYLELPDIDAAIADPASFTPMTDPSQLYTFCTGLATRADKKTFGNIKKILDKIPPEYAVWTIDDCLTRNRDEIGSHPAYIEWVHKNIEYAA